MEGEVRVWNIGLQTQTPGLQTWVFGFVFVLSLGGPYGLKVRVLFLFLLCGLRFRGLDTSGLNPQ